jgi:hypothetical protein
MLRAPMYAVNEKWLWPREAGVIIRQPTDNHHARS